MSEFNDILLRQFRIDLTERDKNPEFSFFKLKYNYDFSDICYIIDNFCDKNKNYSDFIYGRSIPNSISELGDSKILIKEGNNTFEKEVNWVLLSIRKYCDKLQVFINKKEEYEKALIIGDYLNANILLDEIEKEVCFSLWGIEQRFILIEIEKGLKENTKFLVDINEQNKKWFIKRFSHFYSLKAEKELSVNQYSLSLARLLFRYIESDNHTEVNYYNFKLNFLEIDNHTSYSDFLAIEGCHSIIDKYLALVRIFQLSVYDGDRDNMTFLDSRIYYLSKKVKDFSIDKLRLLIDTNFDFEFDLREQDRFAILVLDYYTNGEYEKVENLLKNRLIKSPLSIELYEVYLKSLILQDKKFEIIGVDSNSFQNRILSALYEILLRNDSMYDCLNEIRRIAYNLSSIPYVSFYLMNYFKNERGEENNNFKQKSNINTNFLNPSFIMMLSSSCKKRSIPEEYLDSSSLDYLFQQQQGSIESIKSSKLSPYRKKILTSYLHQKNNSFEDAISLLEEMLLSSTLKNFQREKILQNLFKCYEELSLFDKCINLFVDNYFNNPLLVSNIKVVDVKKNIKTAKYKNVKHSINLPLFYKLTDSEDYDVHTAYECYLLHNNCFIPSELIEVIKNDINVKIIYFLSDICTLDIFKHSPFILNSKHKYEERIRVCNSLIYLNKTSEIEYYNEIERLTKRLIIQKGIQEIDESKIYVNQTGIIESELKNITFLYKRFKMMGELKSEKDISILTLDSDKMFSLKKSDVDGGNEFSKDPQFDIYKDIFYFLRDEFLFSNYGLQQYLSARIRHGVLLGEIRPIFEKLKLITEKEKGINRYKSNDNWRIVTYNLDVERKIKFQEIFSVFSTSIDSLINEEILSKSLQIKIEDKNTDGWLDYNFDDFYLKILFIAHKDTESVEEFTNNIFSELWSKTENNLAEIKVKINGEIKDKFFELLLNLERELSDLLGKLPGELTNNINEARVNIENKLIKIANWFSITETNISNFQIEKIVDVCLEYHKSINPIKEIFSNVYIKGNYYPSLVDLVRIFMDNAAKHSGFEGENINFYVSIKEYKDQLIMQFRNPLNASIDLKSLKEKIDSFTLDLNISMKEKGSGFHKAMRIIKSDLMNTSNDMLLKLSEDNEFCIDISLNKKILSV